MMTRLSTVTSDVKKEVLQTWSQRRGPRSAVRVDWPLVVDEAALHVVRQGTSSVGVSALTLSGLSAFDELAPHRDPSTLLRCAVELSRSRLGFERAAVLLLSGDGTQLTGSWGTDGEGRTCDEGHICFDLGQAHRDAFARAQSGVARWLVLGNAPLIAQTESGARVIAYGWNALVPIRGRTGEAVGLFVCDSAATRRDVDHEQLCAASVFCSLLGTRLESFRSSVSAGAIALDPLVARAVARLREDPELTREALAQELGVSVTALGKRFKSELCESIRDYRNRVKLERFVTLAEGRPSKLLATALDAGFGSYAQFHRVFRAHMGCSPKDYLRQRAKTEA